MTDILRFSQIFNVDPGTELIVSVGNETMIHRVGSNSKVRVEIMQREDNKTHAVKAPVLGSPTLGIVADPAPMDIKTRAHEAACEGLKG